MGELAIGSIFAGVTGPPITVGHRPQGVAVAEGSVWVTNHDDNTVSRIKL